MVVVKKMCDVFGDMNVLFMGAVGECAQLFSWGFIKESPPTVSALVTSGMDAFILSLPWVPMMYYSYRIAPPDLVSTMASTACVFQFTIGK